MHNAKLCPGVYIFSKKKPALRKNISPQKLCMISRFLKGFIRRIMENKLFSGQTKFILGKHYQKEWEKNLKN